MNVEEYLANFFKGTKNPSLNAMRYFMNEFNHPEKDLKIIHIAGTNGKGSCTEMMTNILINAGLKVGKFISPHLISYNERISVNNKNITDKEMEELIEIIKPKIDKYNSQNATKITLFELETTMGLLYFKKNKCDVVVMETGLGGTYDCTNIVTPIASLITSIGFDHVNILGNTLLEIAENKAGIIKQNSETVFVKQAEEEVNSLVEQTCKEKNNILHLIKNEDISNYSYDSEIQKFDYKNYKNIEVNLKGEKQVLNGCICIECVEILKNKDFNISEEALRKGLKTVIHKGRFEKISDNPLIIYDGAHNEPAIKNFRNSVSMYYKNEKKVYIVSILKTKDYKTIIKELVKGENSSFIFTDGNSKERYVAKEELFQEAKKYSQINNLYKLDLSEAICKIKEDFRDYVTFVVGSFYIYGDVIKLL